MVGSAVLKKYPSTTIKPSAPTVYGTPSAIPVKNKDVELAAGVVTKFTELAGVFELSTGRKFVGAGAPTVTGLFLLGSERLAQGNRTVNFER